MFGGHFGSIFIYSSLNIACVRVDIKARDSVPATITASFTSIRHQQRDCRRLVQGTVKWRGPHQLIIVKEP
jgi:hypothetical protein